MASGAANKPFFAPNATFTVVPGDSLRLKRRRAHTLTYNFLPQSADPKRGSLVVEENNAAVTLPCATENKTFSGPWEKAKKDDFVLVLDDDGKTLRLERLWGYSKMLQLRQSSSSASGDAHSSLKKASDSALRKRKAPSASTSSTSASSSSAASNPSSSSSAPSSSASAAASSMGRPASTSASDNGEVHGAAAASSSSSAAADLFPEDSSDEGYSD